jgi:hypothetical protein
MAVPSPPEVPQALELYRAGDTAAAVDTFLRGTCGAPYRPVLEKAVPGALEQTLADAATFFEHELPALRQWSLHKLLLEWLPNVEPFVLSDAGHLLHLQNPSEMAAGLASFFARHSLGLTA